MTELEEKLEAAFRKSMVELKKLRQQLDSVERRQREPIAVIGMSCRFPGGANSPEQYWELLRDGVDGITEVPKNRWDVDAFYDPDPDAIGKIVTRRGGFIDSVDEFDADLFRISHREAQELDPQQRLLLEVVWEAVERAGIAPESLENTPTGVYIGASFCDYNGIMQSNGADAFGAYSALGINLSALNGRVSYALGLMGPSMAIDTACSSSLVGLDLACASLQRGDTNLAVAGGIYLMLSPSIFIMLSRAKMLAPDGHCKTFDASGDGYARGEGVGVVILKRLSDAERDGDRILAVIRGTSVNQDGPSSGLTVPNRHAQVKLIETALQNAKLKPTDVGYVEAHGTGTALGDPIEVGAIKDAYGVGRTADNPLLLGSVKSNIGHLEGAAGIAGVIKLILALSHEALPGNLHFKELNPKIDLHGIPGKILTELTPWKRVDGIPRRAGISSFGFTGTNAHAIIEEAPLSTRAAHAAKDRELHILTLSAKSEAALASLLVSYQQFLANSTANLSDICYTSNVGRNHDYYRIAVVAGSLEELQAKLKSGLFYQGESVEQSSLAAPLQLDPNALAEAYCHGAAVDWKQLHSPYARIKILLPTYPFQHTRFPLKTTLPARKEDSKDDIFFDWTWQKQSLPDLPHPLGHYLVIGGDQSIVDAIKARGGSCRCVPPPSGTDGYVSLLKEGSFAGILHLASLSDPGPVSAESIRKAQIHSTESFLNLVHALSQIDATLRTNVFVVTRVHPAYSPLIGLFKTAVLEHPELSIKLVDLEGDWDPGQVIQALFAQEREIYLRVSAGAVCAPRIQRHAETAVVDLRIRSDSSYLITGALGGLGQKLAEWLKERGAGCLVLTGRRAPDEQLLKALEGPNTQVLYQALDMSDEDGVRDLIERINASSKPLKGIFHLAGILDDATLLDLDWPRFEKVYASKVYGSYYLHKFSKDLDYFVLYSSLASTLGSPGQANYAAASAFMDSLCEYKRKLGLPATAISWGPWDEIGMAKDLVARHERAGFLAIKPKVGIEALETVLRQATAHITVARMNWKTYVQHLIEPPPWLDSFAEHRIEKKSLLARIDAVAPGERMEIVTRFVTEIVRDVLQVPEGQVISKQMGFFDMGMDSLMAVEIKNRLQASLEAGMDLESVAVFNYPNIEAMTKHIAGFYALGDGIKVEKTQEEEISEKVDAMNIEDVIKRLKDNPNG